MGPALTAGRRPASATGLLPDTAPRCVYTLHAIPGAAAAGRASDNPGAAVVRAAHAAPPPSAASPRAVAVFCQHVIQRSNIECLVPPRSTSAADSLPRAGAAGLFDDRQRTALDGGGAEQLQPHWRRWHSISDVTFYTWAEQVRRVGGLGDAR